MADEWTLPKGDLMKGKRGLVMGVANDHSIAWGIAKQLAYQGAELAFTYQGEALEKRVRPLAESVGATLMVPADVTDDASMDRAFAEIASKWGKLDFLVHAIAFADKSALKGSFVENTTREMFKSSMDISAYSFVDACRRAAPLMKDGGSIITLTYQGSERVVPNYNMMGVAKAALEASTRYIARDLGPILAESVIEWFSHPHNRRIVEKLRAGIPGGLAAFLGFSGAQISDSIWKGQRWSNTMRHLIDGLIYGLLTGGAFGWLWPR